jgi:hypothetical protein
MRDLASRHLSGLGMIALGVGMLGWWAWVSLSGGDAPLTSITLQRATPTPSPRQGREGETLNIDGYEVTLHAISPMSYGLRVVIEIRNVTADKSLAVDPHWLLVTTARGETIRGDGQDSFPRQTLLPGARLRGVVVVHVGELPDQGTLAVAYVVPGGTLTWLAEPVSAIDDDATPASSGVKGRANMAAPLRARRVCLLRSQCVRLGHSGGSERLNYRANLRLIQSVEMKLIGTGEHHLSIIDG